MVITIKLQLSSNEFSLQNFSIELSYIIYNGKNWVLLHFLISEEHICPSNPTLETGKLPNIKMDVILLMLELCMSYAQRAAYCLCLAGFHSLNGVGP